MKRQQGFTLIELIAVIVILGILAATAVPRFVNLQDAARESATQAMAGSLESASALNFAAELAQTAGIASANPIATNVTGCAGAGALLASPVPAEYTLGPATTTFSTAEGANNAAADQGDFATCTVTNGSITENFILYWAN